MQFVGDVRTEHELARVLDGFCPRATGRFGEKAGTHVRSADHRLVHQDGVAARSGVFERHFAQPRAGLTSFGHHRLHRFPLAGCEERGLAHFLDFFLLGTTKLTTVGAK